MITKQRKNLVLKICAVWFYPHRHAEVFTQVILIQIQAVVAETDCLSVKTIFIISNIAFISSKTSYDRRSAISALVVCKAVFKRPVTGLEILGIGVRRIIRFLNVVG